MEHVLLECDGYRRFRRKWKVVALRESKSGLVSILGYGGMSGKLECDQEYDRGYMEGKGIVGNGVGTLVYKGLLVQCCFPFKILPLFFMFYLLHLFIFVYFNITFLFYRSIFIYC